MCVDLWLILPAGVGLSVCGRTGEFVDELHVERGRELVDELIAQNAWCVGELVDELRVE